MITVPQGFVMIERGPLTLVLQQESSEQLLGCGLGDPERLCACQTGVMHTGRGAMPTIELESSPERIIVRKYRRGGMLRFLNNDIFLGNQRPFHELAVTLYAARADIPVADVLGAVSLRVCGPLYRHYLVLRELSGCCDLPAWFQDHDFTAEDCAALAQRVANLVRHMHDQGLYHADLNLKNILVNTGDARKLYIIDWDKSKHGRGACADDERMRNVVRLCRSAEKLRALHAVPIPEQFTDIFLEQYWQSPSLAESSRHSLRRALKYRVPSWRFLQKIS